MWPRDRVIPSVNDRLSAFSPHANPLAALSVTYRRRAGLPRFPMGKPPARKRAAGHFSCARQPDASLDGAAVAHIHISVQVAALSIDVPFRRRETDERRSFLERFYRFVLSL